MNRNCFILRLIFVVILGILVYGSRVPVQAAAQEPQATATLAYFIKDSTPGARVVLFLDLDTRERPLGGYEVVVSYNPAVVTLVDAAPGSTPEFGTDITAVTTPGSVALSGRNDVFLNSPTGNVHVATLEFLIIGQPGAYTDFDLSVGQLFDTSLAPMSFSIRDTGLLVGELAFAQVSQFGLASGDAVSQARSWDEVKAAFAAQKEKWQPTLDKLNVQILLYHAVKGDAQARQRILGEIAETTGRLNALIDPFLKKELKALVANQPALADLVKGLDNFTVVVEPFLRESTLGLTDKDKRRIELNLKVFDQAETFFTTGFHEATHATKGTDHGGIRDSDFYAQELWTRDQENEFRGYIGIAKDARTRDIEYGYTLAWAAEHGLLEKQENGKYKATDRGKQIGDCYLKKLREAQPPWKWEKDVEPDAATGVVIYFQAKWKAEKTKHKTKSGLEFEIITATESKYFGEGGYDPQDPCDRGLEQSFLQGTVTDTSTASPIPAATVEAVGPTSRSTSTDASGQYSLFALSAGGYTVTASRGGYQAQTVSGVVVSDGAVTTQNFALTPTGPQLAVGFGGVLGANGTVTSIPAGIDCSRTPGGGLSGTCSARFALGSAVILRAFPAPGSAFDRWFGHAAGCGATPACQVTMTQDRGVSAFFLPPQELTVGIRGLGASGTVTSSPAGIDCTHSGGVLTVCRALFGFGTVVTLTETPAEGSAFDRWFSAPDCLRDPTCQVTMDQGRGAVAFFTVIF